MKEQQCIALLYEALIHGEGSQLIKDAGIDVIALQGKLDGIVPQPLGNYDKLLIEACEDVMVESKGHFDETFNSISPKK